MLEQAQADALNDIGLTALFANWDTALAKRDRETLAACYAPDVLVHDVGGTLRGFDALWAQWTACFPFFEDTIRCERRDIEVVHGDVVCLITFRSRMSGMTSDHPAARSWYRTSIVVSRQGDHAGDWKIVHEHVSLGLNVMAETPVYDHNG